jgi:hypothetical protein
LNLIIVSRVVVTYNTGFRLDDWIYCTLYIHRTRVSRPCSAIATLHTFQFTVAHALGSSVFTSRILATDLSQSHCHFKSPMKCTFHHLIPFLPLFCSCQFRRLHSRLLFSSRSPLMCPFVTPRHGPHRKHSLCCYGGVFTGTFPSN